MLPCFHLKQNGLNQIIVAQTLAVFLHLEISYYSGEAIYQKKKKKKQQPKPRQTTQQKKTMDRKTKNHDLCQLTSYSHL